MVDQDAAHQLGRNTEELCAVLPLCVRLINKSEVNLVYESGGLKSVIPALASHVTGGLVTEFVINERDQLVQRFPVAVAPSLKQLSNVLC
jgi:hypothetical protein